MLAIIARAVLVTSCLVAWGCAPPVTTRVVSYNIHHGEGVDGRFDLERIAEVIIALDPDLVALQEVDRGTRRSGGIDQASVLAMLTGRHHAYGRAMPYDGGEYGVAILSRWPIVEATNDPLPYSEGHEPRTALSVVVESPKGRRLRFISTHFQHDSGDDRLEQARRLNRIFDGENEPPMILAGDLNAEPGSPPMQELLEWWTPAILEEPPLTFSSTAPDRTIDWILLKPGRKWTVFSVEAIDEPVASDHRPLVAVVRVR
ncbi:MAG: endonuclease/exonuclease/phosphatase family protein [Planctomycetota bacterium]